MGWANERREAEDDMSGRYRNPQPALDLGDVLSELGHTPESFARTVGRNASGLRRAIRGESRMTPSAARDVIEGLYAEGWKGDPNRIVQLRKAVPGATMNRLRERTEREPPKLSSQARVRMALADLMRALGREEVDRVYGRVFGTKPGEKE